MISNDTKDYLVVIILKGMYNVSNHVPSLRGKRNLVFLFKRLQKKKFKFPIYTSSHFPALEGLPIFFFLLFNQFRNSDGWNRKGNFYPLG